MPDSPASITFTGFESDLVVGLAKRALTLNLPVAIEVRGREPITSETITIAGAPVGAILDGYNRTLQLRTSSGNVYDIGGANTTKSIASDFVTFHQPPPQLFPEIAGADDLDHWLANLDSGTQVMKTLMALGAGLRTGIFDRADELAITQATLPSASAPHASVRVAALRVVVRGGGASALPTLARALDDVSPHVRREAALRIRSLDSPLDQPRLTPESLAYLQRLSESLLNDPDRDVRIFAAEGLGYLYHPIAREALRHAMEHDGSEHVRWAATVAISRSNDLDAFPAFFESLNRESNTSIRKAAFLGIGRHAADLKLHRPDLARSSVESLAEEIGSGALESRGYALHALGEFGELAASRLEQIATYVDHVDLEVRSAAATALNKLINYVGPDSRLRRSILERLHTALQYQPAPRVWPALGFERRFLAASGDIALALEDFEAAAQSYSQAQSAHQESVWLIKYYMGMSAFAHAEATVGPTPNRNLSEAIQSLNVAIEAFNEVRDLYVKSRIIVEKSGLELKQILAEARLSILLTWVAWRDYAMTASEIAAIRLRIGHAAELYRRLDLTNLDDTQRSLGAHEVALISCLILYVQLTDDLCLLYEAALARDSSAISISIANVRVQARRLTDNIQNTASEALHRMRPRIAEVLERSGSESRSDVEVAALLLDLLPACLQERFPSPGTCPVVSFGEAEMSVKLADVAAGSGDRTDPFAVDSRHSLVFDVLVSVLRRTKDDELLLTADGPVTPRSNAMQYIPVHEGVYALRPIDFGGREPSSTAMPFVFSLSFRNRGCLQLAAQREVWVRQFDYLEEAIVPAGRMDSELAALRREVSELERLESEYSTQPGLEARRRRVSGTLSEARSRVAALEAALHI